VVLEVSASLVGWGSPPSSCSMLKTGSPKAISSVRSGLAGGKFRSVLSAADDGIIETACVRASQGTVP